jgi:hypothetical protein
MPALANKRVLTELLLQRLRPRAQRFLVWDSKQNGLALQRSVLTVCGRGSASTMSAVAPAGFTSALATPSGSKRPAS